MPLRLYTNSSGYGTQLRGGVLGRYGSQSAPRSPWALFFGAGGQPQPQASPGGTYQNPPPQVEGAARAAMGRAVGSIVGATQDGGRLIVRGVDGRWYITDNQGVPVQQTTAQAAQQLVTSGQFKSWAGTVMPDGNIQWANMSPGDANSMALAQGVPVDANGDATAPTATTTGAPPPTKGGDISATGTVPAGMKFVGIAADGKTLIFTDSSGATHLYSRDPNTMQLTPITGTPKPTGTGAGTTTGTTPPTGTAPSSTTPPAGATTLAGVTSLPATSTEPGVTAPPPDVAPPPTETPVGGTGTFSQVGTVTPGPTNFPGDPVLTQPLPDSSPSGTPSTPPSTLYDVLNAAPDSFALTPEQIAALQGTPVDSTMFSPPDLASSEPASAPADVPPPPVTGGGGGARLM